MPGEKSLNFVDKKIEIEYINDFQTIYFEIFNINSHIGYQNIILCSMSTDSRKILDPISLFFNPASDLFNNRFRVRGIKRDLLKIYLIS